MAHDSDGAAHAFNVDELFGGLSGQALVDRIDWLNRLIALLPLLNEPGMGRALMMCYDEPVARDLLAAINVMNCCMAQRDSVRRIVQSREFVVSVQASPGTSPRTDTVD